MVLSIGLYFRLIKFYFKFVNIKDRGLNYIVFKEIKKLRGIYYLVYIFLL